MPKPTIVLVHGAWADGSSWNAVASELQGQDFTVFTPPNLLRQVAIDAPYVASIPQRTSGPVVLVGHSYGGFVITNAATGGGDVRALPGTARIGFLAGEPHPLLPSAAPKMSAAR